MELILEVKDLKKYYKESKVVDGLSFNLYEGEILGFLGLNGVGKSIIINIFLIILKYDEGKIMFFGIDINDNKKWIKFQFGIVFQELVIFEEILVYRNVEFFIFLYGFNGKKLKNVVLEVLKMVGFEDKKNSKLIIFFGGMK